MADIKNCGKCGAEIVALRSTKRMCILCLSNHTRDKVDRSKLKRFSCEDCGGDIWGLRKSRKVCTDCQKQRGIARVKEQYVSRKIDKTCGNCESTFKGIKNGSIWCDECRPEAKSLMKEAYKTTHQYKTARYRKYGLSVEDHDAMLEQQGGGCAICYTQEDLCIDHDHDTGKVRGILCRTCNLGIGKLRDDVRLAKLAYEYLLRFSEAMIATDQQEERTHGQR